ncbi:glycosyltransferase family 2 protein [Paenibacillus psychroresistens]|uniref:glycosyltransferase family 2 protein n=1 Tax=Paenibacillus psychroresistens TaxID=1778678 RepID=UPI001390AA5D|nr:glycosyltransferase [Paenibacillus psychroresistens]
MRKLISVIVPVFNAAEYLHSCIESILNQSETDFELLLINDGSTDRSEEIILSYSDSRIKYVKQINQGVAVTRNLAIDMAKGNYIVFQDADDISVPSRFDILKRHFFSDSVGLVHSDVLLIDSDDKPVGYYSNRNIDRKRALRYFFKIGTPICGGTVMVRREVFRDVRYDPALKIGEDNDVLSKITQDWDSIHVPEPLYLYRRHGNNSAREIRYDMVFAHVQKLLEVYSLQELIPEINWNNGDYGNNQARALSIISLFLKRRGMYLHVENWRKAAEDKASEADSKHFIEGITFIIEEDYAKALKAFQLCNAHDHIVENYKGECYALLREVQDAVHCFLESLNISPAYSEPIDNLKGLGGLSNFNMGDITWLKFR